MPSSYPVMTKEDGGSVIKNQFYNSSSIRKHFLKNYPVKEDFSEMKTLKPGKSQGISSVRKSHGF